MQRTEDYINIARRIFSGTRYNASDEDVKRGSSGSCILVPDVFLPVVSKTLSSMKIHDFIPKLMLKFIQNFVAGEPIATRILRGQ